MSDWLDGDVSLGGLDYYRSLAAPKMTLERFNEILDAMEARLRKKQADDLAGSTRPVP